MAMRAAVLTNLAGRAAAHGGIVHPPAREETVALWFNEGCQIGCQECQGRVKVNYTAGPVSICTQDMEPTLDPALRTYFMEENPDAFRYNPWSAPGHSPVFSPCGLAAGQTTFYPFNGDVPPAGYKPGFDGRNISGGNVTEWPIGSIQEISWNIEANHGGGYAVRLCPLASEQTEECFQKHHLPFEGDTTWIQLGEYPTVRTPIRANRTTEGTNPSGSQWTKVPIPSCGGEAGGGHGCDDGCDAPQFESPIPGLWGNGPTNGCAGCDKRCPKSPVSIFFPNCNRKSCGKSMDYQIVDLVKVPDLPVGDYTLSFRWDCEQTPQIWAQCSNIRIVSQAVV
jgi:hypothetical protein